MMPLLPKHKILIALNTMVWGLAGLMHTGTIQLAASRRSPVEIVSEPARVRIILNGSPYSNGEYITTPHTLHVNPGKHKITVQRSGYHSNTSNIITNIEDTPQKITTTLESIGAAFHEVVVELQGEGQLPNATVSIDEGLERGEFPLTASDLLPGKHILELQYGYLNKTTARCQFELPALPSETPTKILVERVGAKVRVQGCKRIAKP